jgi:hypothetical protein
MTYGHIRGSWANHGKPELTVMQLGDNVSNGARMMSFQGNLHANACSASAEIQQALILSTWWEATAKDRGIQNIADLTPPE